MKNIQSLRVVNGDGKLKFTDNCVMLAIISKYMKAQNREMLSPWRHIILKYNRTFNFELAIRVRFEVYTGAIKI